MAETQFCHSSLKQDNPIFLSKQIWHQPKLDPTQAQNTRWGALSSTLGMGLCLARATPQLHPGAGARLKGIAYSRSWTLLLCYTDRLLTHPVASLQRSDAEAT